MSTPFTGYFVDCIEPQSQRSDISLVIQVDYSWGSNNAHLEALRITVDFHFFTPITTVSAAAFPSDDVLKYMIMINYSAT
jgi:hypothetical protein